MIQSHLKLEFQRLLKLSGASGDPQEGWKVQVNDRFVVKCRFAGSHFCMSGVLGQVKDLRNKGEAYKELLQNMTRNLPSIREVLSIDPASNELILTRTVRKPTLLSELESAVADFANTFEFFSPIYQSHVN